MINNKKDKEIIDRLMKKFDKNNGGSKASSLTIEEASSLKFDLQ